MVLNLKVRGVILNSNIFARSMLSGVKKMATILSNSVGAVSDNFTSGLRSMSRISVGKLIGLENLDDTEKSKKLRAGAENHPVVVEVSGDEKDENGNLRVEWVFGSCSHSSSVKSEVLDKIIEGTLVSTRTIEGENQYVYSHFNNVKGKGLSLKEHPNSQEFVGRAEVKSVLDKIIIENEIPDVAGNDDKDK